MKGIFTFILFAVLIKLRLSHRYLMPEMAVTAATSQHSTMETAATSTTRTACSEPVEVMAQIEVPKK